MTKKENARFSIMSKSAKREWLADNLNNGNESLESFLSSFDHADSNIQKILDRISENTIGNFPLPLGICPHLLVNNKEYVVPMVIEESSVIAAVSSAAKYWKSRGGVTSQVTGMTKIGHVHFYWYGNPDDLKTEFINNKSALISGCEAFTKKMQERGGGITNMGLLDKTNLDTGYYQIEVEYDTVDSMGANFINSTLEKIAESWKHVVHSSSIIPLKYRKIDIIMCILSNYTPKCVVRSSVNCKIEELGAFKGGISASQFAEKFEKAIKIAVFEPYRAVTHNKGIYNGVDAVVIATGNDFRAIESCGHAYASRTGQYKSLSNCQIDKDQFSFFLELPLPIGTVGGLTNLHPLASFCLKVLKNPKAKELMEIIGAVGLMQNFAALKSLITTGIQKGHMKMHLTNILYQLKATESEMIKVRQYFENKIISFSNVREYLMSIRDKGVS